jgi:hypothetical protein
MSTVEAGERKEPSAQHTDCKVWAGARLAMSGSGAKVRTVLSSFVSETCTVQYGNTNPLPNATVAQKRVTRQSLSPLCLGLPQACVLLLLSLTSSQLQVRVAG